MDTLDRGLTRLFREGEDASMTLLMALRHAMSLHKARVALDAGAPMDNVVAAARMFYKRKAAFQRQLTRWPASALEGAIASLREGMAHSRRNGGLGRDHRLTRVSDDRYARRAELGPDVASYSRFRLGYDQSRSRRQIVSS